MALTKKSWALASYTINTWTDFVASSGDSTVKAVNICNGVGSDILLSMRVTNSGGSAQATIMSAVTITAGTAYKLDTDPLNLTSSQKLQIYADTVGLEFYGSGVQH